MRGDDWFITPRELEALVKRYEKMHTAAFTESLLPAAMICANVYNLFRDEKKQSEPFKAADFMPQEKKEVKELTEHEKLTIKRDEWRRAFVLVGGGGGR